MKNLIKTTVWLTILCMGAFIGQPAMADSCSWDNDVGGMWTLTTAQWNNEWHQIYNCSQNILTSDSTTDNDVTALGSRLTVLEDGSADAVNKITDGTYTGTFENFSTGNFSISFVGAIDYDFDQSLATGDSVEFDDFATNTLFLNKVLDSADDSPISTQYTHILINSISGGGSATLPVVNGEYARVLFIKDFTGTAGTNHITLNAYSGETIDGQSSYVIDQNYGYVILISDGVSKWSVASESSGVIGNNSLTDNDLANGSVGALEVANNSLTGSDIDESTFVAGVFSDNTVIGSNAIVLSSDGTGIFTGGVKIAGNLSVGAGRPFYLDGGGDSYLYQQSDNTLSFVTGGSGRLLVSNTAVTIGGTVDLIMGAGKKFYLDSGVDTYITESSANNVSVYTNGSERMKIDAGGSIFFPTIASSGSGVYQAYIDATTKELYRFTSSRRYKTDITDLDVDSEKIYDLRPVSYSSWNPSKTVLYRSIGLIAEEVEEIDSRLVIHRPEDNLPDGVHYEAIPILMLKEMQKMRVQIQDLNAKVLELEARLNE